MTPAVERLRAAVACLVLTAAVFVQRPGLLVPDTKLDLAVDPSDLLSRALHLWDPEGGAGQLQNQAYGYLFPMGPFFALLQAAELPPWAVQRLWQALVLCTAFLGVRTLAARLGLGTPGTRLLAAAVYALAPRPLSQLGAISVEVWPYALAPWVLVPLVTGATRGSPRRAAALSGVALLCVGGVNAAATLAVVPLGVLWLATRAPGPRRRALAGWWAAAVVLACAWWAGPLVLLGRYSPPFLDVIESAAVTTGQTGLWSVLTGNDLWQQYLLTSAGPARPAGFLLVTVPALVLCTTALAALGLAALLRPTTPHRGFLAGGVLLGVCVVGAGHLGGLRLQAGLERDLLDAALAPFRNVHKYDLLLRLPLALGLAALAAQVQRPQVRLAALRRPVAVLAGLALVGAASPLLRVQPPGAFSALPSYWQETADFLDAASSRAGGRALVVPAAASGQYVWGRPGDEPLQPLARSPWVVRDAVPLGGPGTTRVLDAVNEVLLTGRGSPALAAFLARAGVRHLVVRNDLDLRATGAVRPLAVHAALQASPGLRRVAFFGPPVGAGLGVDPLVLDAGLQPLYPAVEVYEVDGGSPEQLVAAPPRSALHRVSGGPESVLPLLEAGVLAPSTPARLAGEGPLPGDAAERRVVTDGYRDREADFGRATDPRSATLGAGLAAQAERPVHDHLPVPPGRSRTTAQADGLHVTASSSGAEAGAVVARGRDHVPVAAFDGLGSTTWVTGGLQPRGEWVQAEDPAGLRAQRVRVRAAEAPGLSLRLTRVRVTTDDGVDAVAALPADVALGPASKRVRVTVLEAVDGTGAPQLGAVALEAGLLRADGVRRAARPLRVPQDAAVATGGRPARGAPVLAFEAARRDRPACLPLGGRVQCDEDLVLADEDSAALDRLVVLDAPATFTVAVRAVPRPGAALDDLLQRGQVRVNAQASSRLAHPAARPAAAVDRDLSTAWTADPDDAQPRLVLGLGSPQTVAAVRVVTDPFLPASRPRSVTVSTDPALPGDPVRLDADGVAVLPAPLRDARVLFLGFPEVQRRTSLGLDRFLRPLPVGVSEVALEGPAPGPVGARSLVDPPVAATRPDLRQVQVLRPDAEVRLPCGQGPALNVDGVVQGTRVVATVADLLALHPVTVVPCTLAPLVLSAGQHRVVLARSELVQHTGLTLVPQEVRQAPTGGRPVEVLRWGASERRVRLGAGTEALLLVRENANAGWQATLRGARLRPLVLDGWQQAFVVPAGEAGEVRLRFAPDVPYRAALLAGGLLALLLVALAALPGRPGPPAAVGRPARPLLVVALSGGAVLLSTGGAGALLLPLALLVRRRVLLPVVGPSALVAAGAVVALRPWPDRALLGLPVTLLCAAAVACLAVSLWSRPDPGRAAAAPAPPPT